MGGISQLHSIFPVENPAGKIKLKVSKITFYVIFLTFNGNMSADKLPLQLRKITIGQCSSTLIQDYFADFLHIIIGSIKTYF